MGRGNKVWKETRDKRRIEKVIKIEFIRVEEKCWNNKNY